MFANPLRGDWIVDVSCFGRIKAGGLGSSQGGIGGRRLRGKLSLVNLAKSGLSSMPHNKQGHLLAEQAEIAM